MNEEQNLWKLESWRRRIWNYWNGDDESQKIPSPPSAPINQDNEEIKDVPNNGIINDDKSKDNSNTDEFKIEELQGIPSPQSSKSSPFAPISQDSKETKDELNNGIINENKAIIDESKDDSKETKGEPYYGIINKNKEIVDKSVDNSDNDKFKIKEQLSKSPPSAPISQDSKETKDELNNGIINENKAIVDKSKDNNDNDEFKIKELPQSSKSPPSAPINQDSKETKNELNNGIINENKVIIDESKNNNDNDEFKIKELLQSSKSPPSAPISQDSKETKGEPYNGIINENKAIVDESVDNSDNNEFKIKELPQLFKSPPSAPTSQDSKETKGEPYNGIINENKAIVDKPKNNWSRWLDEAIQNDHINFYEYGSRFKDIEKIGSGGFSKVYKAILDNSSACALKSYKHSIANTREIANELKLLRKVNHHQNIIRFYGVTKDESKKRYLLVLEYADNGTLRNYLQEKGGSTSWDLKLKFAYEIASAVSCLHKNNIIHRDLHSNNILVHQKTIKLVDFGLSRKILELTATSVFQLAGVLPYIDPQCFKNNSKPNKESDVYGVGVLLWELTSNKPPFSNHDQHYQQFTLMFDISQGIREEPIPNTPDEYINLYKACWQEDPTSRPGIQKVETMLNGMISSSNIIGKVDKVDKVDKEENYGQPKNEDNDSFSHPSIISTEPTSIGSLQTKFDNLLE